MQNCAIWIPTFSETKSYYWWWTHNYHESHTQCMFSIHPILVFLSHFRWWVKIWCSSMILFYWLQWPRPTVTTNIPPPPPPQILTSPRVIIAPPPPAVPPGILEPFYIVTVKDLFGRWGIFSFPACTTLPRLRAISWLPCCWCAWTPSSLRMSASSTRRFRCRGVPQILWDLRYILLAVSCSTDLTTVKIYIDWVPAHLTVLLVVK